MKPTLLAPVRDLATFHSALHAGADAVYCGVGAFNMRANQKGIDLSTISDLVKEAHNHGVKVYVPLNVIVYEEEFDSLEQTVRTIKDTGVDAIICWDMAVIDLCKKYSIPFHISTQANVSNSHTAQFFEQLGAECIVLARECTLAQISEIKKKIQCKIEVFCHGAMCVSISGRCFMSHFMNCKSANRGECLQPCRRAYRITDTQTGQELELEDNYVMSPKDMCTLQILDEIIATGVDVLKIEGRARAGEYIDVVTRAYREAIDAIDEGTYTQEKKDELLARVSSVYNRGFSTGFYQGVPGETGWARTGHNQATEKKEYIGLINNYFKKTNIAEMILRASTLAVGDEVYIQGPTTGTERVRITELVHHETGEYTFPCNKIVRDNDEVYKIIPNTEKV